jgi:5-formyltetrahydrofolate cyclo-ligase
VEEIRRRRELLRQKLLKERSALSPGEVRTNSEACCRHVAPLLSADRVVALYAAVRGEIDPSFLCSGLLPTLGQVVWPRVEEDGTLSFRKGPLHPGRFDIPAPAADAPRLEPDIILVPGLAFDWGGHRLGYGRGYYDRALGARPCARRIGLCHSFQLLEELPRRDGDQPVDFVVTPDGARPSGARPLEEIP